MKKQCEQLPTKASEALGSASNVQIVQSKRCHGDLHMKLAIQNETTKCQFQQV